MAEPKDRNEQRNPSDAKADPSAEPKKGGFGAFADKYRERWEAEHPKTTGPDQGTGSREKAPGEPDPTNPTNRPAKP